MKVICDNRYFLIGINKTIEDVIQKNKINGVKNIQGYYPRPYLQYKGFN